MDTRLRRGLWRSAPLQIAAAIALLLLILKILYPRYPSIIFHPGNRLLVADFANYTQNVELASLLKALVSQSLETSPHLVLYPENNIRNYLERELHNRNSPVTVDIARQICVREGISVFLLPRLRSLGSSFIVSADLVEVGKQNLSELSVDTIRARDDDQLLLAMDELSDRVRTVLGESSRSVATTRYPHFPYATPNTAALRSFARALAWDAEGNTEAVIASLKQAVLLDPSFALAHMRLAFLYQQRLAHDAALHHLTVAGENTANLGPRDKQKLLGSYYLLTDQFTKAAEQFQTMANSYPYDWYAPFELAHIKIRLNSFGHAVELCKQAIQRDESRSELYLALAMAHLYNQDAVSARKTWQRALALEPSRREVLYTGGFIDLVENNLADALRAFEKVKVHPSPGSRSMGLFFLAQAQMYGGRFAAALSSLEAGIEEDKRSGATDLEAEKQLCRSRIFQLLGDMTQSLSEAQQIAPLGSDPSLMGSLGVTYASLGRLRDARALLNEIDALPPLPRNKVAAELLRGEIELLAGRPDMAILILTRAKQMQPGNPTSPALARALARAGRWADAEAEYRNVCSRKAELLFPGGIPRFTATWTQALLETGKCLRQLQKRADANQFFRNYLWAMDSADPDFHPVEEARNLLRQR